MVFLEQLWAIARNTFLECIRQPVTLVVVIAACLLVVLSNPFSAFTLEDDQRMYVDIGLSTIFMSGTVLSAFLATSVIDREIGNRTVLTVVSKPVARATFVLGKYLGLAFALVAAVGVPALVFAIVEVHGVIQTAATPVRWPAVAFGAGAVAIATGAAVWANYFYGKSFPATLIVLALPLLAVAYVLSMVFDPAWAAVPIADEFRPEVWIAAGLMVVGLLILAAISVAASTRLGQVPTIVITIGFLLAGLLSDWMLGRRIAAFEKAMAAGDALPSGGPALYWLCKAAYAAIPNFQVFWVVDAVNQNQSIPGEYLANALPYAAAMVAVALALAVALFQRREVG
ncbi:MAG: ABC transporter permease [Phycisphaerales bacterium]|nr:ABC transporter permease [Phycisphaerales bacterium]